MTLYIRDCVSGIEVMNSKGIEVRILNTCPSVSVDKSESIHVILNG